MKMATMKCPNCGNTVDDSRKFCPDCGAQLNKATQEPKQYHVESPQKEKKNRSLLFSILALIFSAGIIGIIFAIIGIVKSLKGMKNPETKGKCTVSLILSIIAIILSVVFIGVYAGNGKTTNSQDSDSKPVTVVEETEEKDIEQNEDAPEEDTLAESEETSTPAPENADESDIVEDTEEDSEEDAAQENTAEENVAEENAEPQLSEEEYKAQCEEYNYKDVLRNPDDFIGKKVKVTVKVSSVHSASWSMPKYYFAYSNDEYDMWFGDLYGVFEYRDEDVVKILEDDIITVYGEIASPQETTSEIVNSEEIFCIDMKYADLLDE